jgi:hypothetical protein
MDSEANRAAGGDVVASASPAWRAIAASVLLLLALAAAAAHGQTAADSLAIRAAALDYIEGWYAGNAERMERSLHPELVKRIVGTRGGTSTLGEMTAAELVAATGRGGGRQTPADRRRTDVRILDVFGNVATVRVDADAWIDYMHLALWNGEWKIVNVLWEQRPREGAPTID